MQQPKVYFKTFKSLEILKEKSNCCKKLQCDCKEKLLEKRKKQSNRTGISRGRPLSYPSIIDKNKSISKFSKTFQIKYEGRLSKIERGLLNSFQNKYIYYAIDDILYLLNSKSKEQERLLLFLYTIMLSLHNNFSVNFFNIWVDTVFINEISNNNKFLVNNYKNSKKYTCITMKVYYTIKPPAKKAQPLW